MTEDKAKIDLEAKHTVKEWVKNNYLSPAGGINCPRCWCELKWLGFDSDNPYDDVIALCPECKHVIIIRVWRIKPELVVQFLDDEQSKEIIALMHTENPFPTALDYIKKALKEKKLLLAYENENMYEEKKKNSELYHGKGEK